MRDLERRKVAAQGQTVTEVMSAAETLYGMFVGGRRRSLSGVARRRQQSVRAQGQVDRLEEKIAEYELGLEEKREAFEKKIEETYAEARDRASEIDERAVGLELEDIRVLEISALWLPLSSGIG